MKVKLVGPKAQTLERSVIENGDDVVSEGHDFVLCLEEYDFVQRTIPSDGPPIVGYTMDYPHLAIEALGIPKVQRTHQWDMMVFRWFDYEYRAQSFVGIPTFGVLNDNTGPMVESGFMTNYLPLNQLDPMFNLASVRSSLRDIRFVGFVGFKVILRESDWFVSGFHLGLPCHGFFNIMEGLRGKLSSFVVGDTQDLFDSWTSNLCLFRYGFPLVKKFKRTLVENSFELVGKHLFLPSATKIKKSYSTEDGLVGVATSWHNNIFEACRRSRHTLRNVVLEDKMYRSDQCNETRKVLAKAQDVGLYPTTLDLGPVRRTSSIRQELSQSGHSE